MNAAETYQITLTREQLQLLCRATETCSRLVMGACRDKGKFHSLPF